MSESKHTPGPWRIGIRQETTFQHETFLIESKGKVWPVAEVANRHQGVELANARLIAAAPDLLEGLEMAVDFLQSPLPDDGEGASNLVDEVLPIIRRARGET